MKLDLKTGWRQILAESREKEAVRFDGGYAYFSGDWFWTRPVVEIEAVVNVEGDGTIFSMTSSSASNQLALTSRGFVLRDEYHTDLIPLPKGWHRYYLRFEDNARQLIFRMDNYEYVHSHNLSFIGYYGGVRNLFLAATLDPNWFPKFRGAIDYVEIRVNSIPVIRWEINEGGGNTIHNSIQDKYHLTLVEPYEWTDGKPFPPQLYKTMKIKEG